jgi:predicted metalloprotease with PDZ domain
LHVGDALTEIQGKTAGEESQQLLARLKPGDTISVKIKSRRGEKELAWKVSSREETSYELKDLDPVTPEQRAHRAAWLRGEAESPQTDSRMSGTTGK